jgi:nucleotide-binding universal stress UspA family protein
MSESEHPRRIVVGVDAIGSADNAICAAIDVAHRFDATIEMVHAVESAHHLGHEPQAEDLDAAKQSIRTRLGASLSGALLPYVSEEHHLVVQAGHASQILLERAAIEGTDLLVIGAHRRRGLLDLRSTAHVLLSHAECPVWIQEGPVPEVRRILVPVDLSDESLLALRTACSWAGSWGATIVALHCFLSPELFYGHGYPVPGPTYVVDQLRDDARADFEAQMAAFAWGDVPHETVFVEASPAAQILEMQDGVDLVMMGTHGRTGLSRVILGNVARTVVGEAHVPVVTLRSAERQWLM